MDETNAYTLTDVARLLDEPAHRLIYFCEKGVVVPDVKESEGRGTSRLFSARNLLEFAVAIRLRDARLPVEVVGAVVHLLRAFAGETAKRSSGFRLPESLQAEAAPDLRIVISDGARLFASLAKPGGAPTLFGGIEIDELLSVSNRGRASGRLAVVRPASAAKRDRGRDDFGGAEGSRFARFEVSITRIARELVLDELVP